MWKYKKETVRIEIVYLIHIPYLEEGHLLIFHLEWGGSSLYFLLRMGKAIPFSKQFLSQT